jgi:solute carrier family 25 (adenine nucleotide translocator) protein 4/5/6/31
MDFLQDLVLGGTSGVVAKTICAPLERVKIVLQTQSANSQLSGARQFGGISDAFRRIAAEQGFASFWRGNTANCLRYFPTQAMNFAFKEKYQSIFVRPEKEVGFAMFFMGYLAAGAAAGATSLTVSYPLEYTYTRLAADVGGADGKRMYTGLMDCISKTVNTDGIRGLYRGYGPSVAGIVVYRAGYFGLYDFSKTSLIPSLQLKEHTASMVAAKFGIALTIDIFSAMLAYPLDTIRRSLMMQSGRGKETLLFNNSLGCLKHIMAKDGIHGLYKGALMNNVRAIGSALVLVIYDELKSAFTK